MPCDRRDQAGVILLDVADLPGRRQALAEGHYFLAPRLNPLKAIFAKLDPPKPRPAPLLPL